MLAKLAAVKEEYKELEEKMADPAILADQEEYRRLARLHASLREIVENFIALERVQEEIGAVRALLSEKDEDLKVLAQEELRRLEAQWDELLQRLKVLLLPKDPRDEKNVILEIRAGTGGEEAALFAADLFRMYAKYAERKGWRLEVMSSSPTELGGFKEIIASIDGDRVFSRLKFESGVHRVQRVPQTEAGGRIHTSAATVAVLPEAEEVEVEIDPDDLRIDVFRSQGHGGQSVNTTDSAVRITHLPTGLVVTCQDEKSQLKNKEKALKILRARLLDKYQQEQHREMAEARRSMVKTGDRSERIRTYNFPQNRLTDHRIDLTIYRLDQIMEGDLDEVIEALLASEQAELLRVQAGG
ncbi:MAG: peptide chain release factor 1 [Firmicutes bacterium]|nr:peptide chain release factor 1 [Bacillota bacterium]